MAAMAAAVQNYVLELSQQIRKLTGILRERFMDLSLDSSGVGVRIERPGAQGIVIRHDALSSFRSEFAKSVATHIQSVGHNQMINVLGLHSESQIARIDR